MKKIIVLLGGLLLLTFTATLWGQAKKPTLMVVPSDVWCTQNGYMTEYDNQGSVVSIPNYKKALQSDPNLLLVISKINTLMMDRGFPLKNVESTLKSIEQSMAEDNMTTSKTSGAAMTENPLDRLKRTAKADIILQLTWTVNTQGPKNSITYNLQGLDAYTNKQIAGAQGTGAQSMTADIPVLLEEAVLMNMDNFTAQLQTFFDDLFAKGREVAVSVRLFNAGSGLDLESEFNDKELGEIIDEWMYNNTVEHRFNKSDASESIAVYEQVRIPLFKANGMPMDTESFVRELRSFLRKDPYKIDSKIINRGLGSTVLVLGEK